MNNKIGPLVIKENNISTAWVSVFRQLLEPGIDSIATLVVEVPLVENNPLEDISIRNELDDALEKHKRYSSHTTANLIFPQSLWIPPMGRHHLYTRYMNIYPEIRRMRNANHNGTYFGRLIQFESGKDGTMINQLEHIVQTYQAGNHRNSALQAAIFDPKKDHTNQRQRGFPCLQHVFFTPLKNKELAITGVYATQNIFDRAYGNYLGLCHLAYFMAHEMELKLTKLVCIASQAKLGNLTKAEGKKLLQRLEYN